MPGTASGLRTDPTARLTELEHQRPEWHVWIVLLGEAAHSLEHEQWHVRLPEADVDGGRFDSSDRPLLDGQTLQVHSDQVLRFLRRILEVAQADGLLPGYYPSAVEALRLVEAAVCQDSAALGALAREIGGDDQALTSLAHLAAFPLMQSCGRILEDRVPGHWPHGHCPICAAWPILAERRGLDRGRYLRCGRCGGAWEVEWLRCIYCGEREHERLGSLVPEETGEVIKIETCASCLGYLKSVAILQAIHPFELLLRDLETVELDLVALDRGYRRPEAVGLAARVRSPESGVERR
jgi:FdhE protein